MGHHICQLAPPSWHEFSAPSSPSSTPSLLPLTGGSLGEAWTSPRHFPDYFGIRQCQRNHQSCFSGECPVGQGFGSPSCCHYPRQWRQSGSHQLREADVTCGPTLCSKLFSLSFQQGGSQGCVPLARIFQVDPSSPAATNHGTAEPEVPLINVLLWGFRMRTGKVIFSLLKSRNCLNN